MIMIQQTRKESTLRSCYSITIKTGNLLDVTGPNLMPFYGFTLSNYFRYISKTNPLIHALKSGSTASYENIYVVIE